jgi:ParB family chromosome partitioning protein
MTAAATIATATAATATTAASTSAAATAKDHNRKGNTIMITTAQTIPLGKLSAWSGNVRKTDALGGIDELAASIAAHGLLQPLIVRAGKKGDYSVVAGRRRLAALRQLAEADRLGPDAVIDCHVISGDADATEISLVENTLREQMHPADQFEAFRKLVDRGLKVEDIAARFGVTRNVVEKRLRLARVSAAVLAAYRQGKLDLEQVMAFAVSDDHKAQEKCLKAMRSDCSPSSIRDHLTSDEIAASGKIARFVTLKAYENAGGKVRRDLFADGDDGIFILDPGLLHDLAFAKLQRAASKIAAEGWKWTEVRLERNWSEWNDCTRAHPEPAPLDAKAARELAALEAEHEKLEAEWHANEDDGAEYPERLRELSDLIHEIESGRADVFTAETMATAGAVVSVGHNGKCEISRGYILPADRPKKAAPKKTANDDGATTANAADNAVTLSKLLLENLALHKSAALTAELMQRPAVALAYLVHAIAADVFSMHGRSCIGISIAQEHFEGIAGSASWTAIEASRETWGGAIPGRADAFLDWCLTQDQSVLLDLLAFCTALCVDVTRGCHEHLEATLKLDMAKWFTPTADNYFGKITKAGILEALAAGKGAIAPAWNTAKKSDLAAIAERELSKSGWLPEVLRSPAVETQEDGS